MSDLQTLPESLSETPPAHSEDVAYKRLTHDQIAKILRLHDENLSQPQIAAIIGVNHTTIGRCLAKFADTSDLALRSLKAKAQKAASRVIDIAENGKPDVSLKAAKVVLAASGVTERVSGINVGVQVIIGTPGSPALNANTITVQAVSE